MHASLTFRHSYLIKTYFWSHQDSVYTLTWLCNLSHSGSIHWLCLLLLPSVQFSHSVVSNSLRPHELQHARPPCPSPTPGVHSNSRPSSQWCHPAISSSVIPFSSCPQSLPASESFPMSQLCTRWPRVLASFLPTNTQHRSPLEWTGWISLQSKGLSRVFSNTTVQKHQFFGALLSSQSLSPTFYIVAVVIQVLCLPLSPEVCSNSCPLSQWCCQTI